MASPADAGASEENCNKNDSFIIEIPIELEPKLTIYRVPRKLRKLKEDAYTPNLISIGPFHHGKRELLAMERHKEKYYEQFCERIERSHADPERFIKTFINGIYRDVHESYAGIPEFDEKKFSEFHFQDMIRLDACFIIELFLKNDEGKNDEGKNHKGKNVKEKEDYILSTAWLKKAIQLDLLLLENQLPYFLLEKLFQFAEPKYKKRESVVYSNREECCISCPCFKRTFCFSSNPDRPTDVPPETPDSENEFLLLACDFFKDFCTRPDNIDHEILKKIKESDKKNQSDEMTKGSDQKMEKIKHFTDLVRLFRLPSNFQKERFQPRVDHLYSATELDKAGVNFVVNDKARLAEVKLHVPCFSFFHVPSFSFYPFFPFRMELPAVMLDDATELLFRNMIALEQCLYSGEAYICNYVSLMSQLIHTEQDADFLVEKKIIKNLSGHGVADLFSRLGNETSVSYFYYADDCDKLNEYHDKWLNRTLTKAKKVYFNDLWKGSSTVVGVFILLFTITQSVKNIFLS
ncbi:hypothetical protein UlMin_012266 [Ulmus minor]